MTETTPLAPSTAEAAAATERLAAWVIGALTAIVIGGVALVIYGPHGGHAAGSSWLPTINASLNATATVLLGSGYVFIRRRRIAAHRACMIAAFAASSLFLITYLIHHAQVHPPRLARSLRPPPADRTGNAAHLALRFGQRRPRVCPPLPLWSLNPAVLGTLTAFAGDRVFVYFAPARRARCRDNEAS